MATPAKTDLIFSVIREPSVEVNQAAEWFTPGRMYRNAVFFAFTCEDRDRRLESGGVKVATKTAIPRGVYRMTVSFSHRFQKQLPEVLDVPQFAGIRCHGGNKAEDSEGCVLVGQVRTSTGVAQCADTVKRLIDSINQAEDLGKAVWLEIK